MSVAFWLDLSAQSFPHVDSCSSIHPFMASSDSEAIVVTGSRRRCRERPAPKGDVAFDFGQLGPPTLVVLIADSSGPWSAELAGRSRQSKALVKRLGDLPRHDGPALPSGILTAVVGLAVICGWRFVHGRSKTADAYTLIQASLGHWPRCQGQRFLEHEVLAFAALDLPPSCVVIPPEGWDAWPAGYAGRALLDLVRSQHALASYRSASPPPAPARVHVETLLEEWSARFGLQLGSCLAWPVAPSLAMAMARGHWEADVSVKIRRASSSTAPAVRLGPAPAIMRRFQREGSDEVLPPPVSSLSLVKSNSGFIRMWHARQLIKGLRFSQYLKDQQDCRPALQAASQFFEDEGQCVATEEKLGQLPHGCTLIRARVRMDVAAMLAHRSWYKENGPTFRYLAYDASPQHGVEIFATVERVIRRADLAASCGDLGQLPSVLERRLPLAVLGSGRMSLADKAQAHIHQVWLEYGPAASDVRRANHDVRQCLSDMGTELGIAEAMDTVEEAIGQPVPDEVRGQLYPWALCIPGTQHIIDSALQASLMRVSWWPAWQKSAKAVCQWLQPLTHRQLLQERLRTAVDAGQHDIAELVKSLNRTVDRFAQWRWKTLKNVTDSLNRVRDATRLAVTTFASAAEFSSKDTAKAAAFFDAVHDSSFWDRSRLLSQLVEPFAAFSSGLRGCSCHEEQLKAGQLISCPWKGCRGRHLAAQLDVVSGQLSHLQEVFADAEGRQAAAAGLARLRYKMAWVNDLPFLIWQSEDPQKASQFLSAHDRAVAARLFVHPVTALFAGQLPNSLRADFQRHADGEGMSEELSVQLQSYMLCKLDDTWPEAVHRDVSTASSRASPAKVPFLASSLRLSQNIAMYDKLSEQGQIFFQRCLGRWRAMAHPNPERARQLTQPRGRTSRDAIEDIYRCGRASLRNWGAELGQKLQPFLPESLPARASLLTRLKVDYLTHVVSIGEVHSLPADESQVDAPGTAQVAVVPFVERPASKSHFFVVVDPDVRRKRQLKTASWLAQQAMGWPVSLQRLTYWGSQAMPEGARERVATLVYRDGFPEVVDALAFASWPAWKGGLKRWSSSPSSIPGCECLSDAQEVGQLEWDWRAGAAPTLAILDKLASDGWEIGQPPAAHTADTSKHTKVKDPLARKAHLTCLVLLGDLRAQGLNGLSSGQPQKYYACVLLSDRPADIPVGLRASDYKSLLDADGQLDRWEGVQQPALQDQDAAGVLAITDKDSDDGVIVHRGRHGAADYSDCPSGVSRPARKRVRTTDHWSQLSWPQGELAAAAPASASSRSLPDGEDIAGSALALVPIESTAASSTGGALLRSVVEGCEVFEERHGVVGCPGYYHRLVVKCPHHVSQLGRPCRKTRVFGCREGRKTGLGDLEPYAFLAAWLAGHASVASAVDHKKWSPGPDVVKEYALQHGWVSPD